MGVAGVVLTSTFVTPAAVTVPNVTPTDVPGASASTAWTTTPVPGSVAAPATTDTVPVTWSSSGEASFVGATTANRSSGPSTVAPRSTVISAVVPFGMGGVLQSTAEFTPSPTSSSVSQSRPPLTVPAVARPIGQPRAINIPAASDGPALPTVIVTRTVPPTATGDGVMPSGCSPASTGPWDDVHGYSSDVSPAALVVVAVTAPGSTGATGRLNGTGGELRLGKLTSTDPNHVRASVRSGVQPGAQYTSIRFVSPDRPNILPVISVAPGTTGSIDGLSWPRFGPVYGQEPPTGYPTVSSRSGSRSPRLIARPWLPVSSFRMNALPTATSPGATVIPLRPLSMIRFPSPSAGPPMALSCPLMWIPFLPNAWIVRARTVTPVPGIVRPAVVAPVRLPSSTTVVGVGSPATGRPSMRTGPSIPGSAVVGRMVDPPTGRSNRISSAPGVALLAVIASRR